jgi:hypothetical protein
MNNLSPEFIAVIAIVVVAALLFLVRRRQPKERTFACGRCSAVVPHTPRTVEAWRAGKNKFFCNACHAQWLRSHPAPAYTRTAAPGRSGCLSVVVLFLLLPAVVVCAWWAYA